MQGERRRLPAFEGVQYHFVECELAADSEAELAAVAGEKAEAGEKAAKKEAAARAAKEAAARSEASAGATADAAAREAAAREEAAAAQLHGAAAFVEEAMRGGGSVLLHCGYGTEATCAAVRPAGFACPHRNPGAPPQLQTSCRPEARRAPSSPPPAAPKWRRLLVRPQASQAVLTALLLSQAS